MFNFKEDSSFSAIIYNYTIIVDLINDVPQDNLLKSFKFLSIENAKIILTLRTDIYRSSLVNFLSKKRGYKYYHLKPIAFLNTYKFILIQLNYDFFSRLGKKFFKPIVNELDLDIIRGAVGFRSYKFLMECKGCSVTKLQHTREAEDIYHDF